MTGTIKKIVEDKLFGFISVEGQSQDVFFHKDKLLDVAFEDLREGDSVSFETESVERGGETKISAIDVRRTV